MITLTTVSLLFITCVNQFWLIVWCLVACLIPCNQEKVLSQRLNYNLADRTCEFNIDTKYHRPSILWRNEHVCLQRTPTRVSCDKVHVASCTRNMHYFTILLALYLFLQIHGITSLDLWISIHNKDSFVNFRFLFHKLIFLVIGQFFKYSD